MKINISKIITVLFICLVANTTVSQELGNTTYQGELAPRLQNLGNHQHPITVRDEMGQRFFNQGLTLAFGFNHREAARAFQEVARLDPDAAMAYWGHALVLGPNINAPMDPENESLAYDLVQQAMALRNKVTQQEADYIEALSERYSGDAEDRLERDRAYAQAMGDLHAKYPDDLDAATLYAESLMDLRPWNYWMRDGTPYDETKKILQALEMVQGKNPDHPGANHYYIHAVEYALPKLAEDAADRLAFFAPGAGHLVHMPSHIYRRIGRYKDATEANIRAVAADEDYITQCRAQGIYPLAYYPHNIHFLWDAATMEGRRQQAVDAAVKLAARITPDMLAGTPMLIMFKVIPLYAFVRFGMWDEILDQPAPPQDQDYWTGIWHYARGTAMLSMGNLEQAAGELEQLTRVAAGQGIKDEVLWTPNSPSDLLQIARYTLIGELAASRGRYNQAVANLHRAVLLQDGLEYIEPPDWHYPVRHSLGAVLLQAGRPREAEVVYWADLEKNPENGWSLYGLLQALRAQDKTEQADAVEQRFRKAWVRSDITLTASRF